MLSLAVHGRDDDKQNFIDVFFIGVLPKGVPLHIRVPTYVCIQVTLSGVPPSLFSIRLNDGRAQTGKGGDRGLRFGLRKPFTFKWKYHPTKPMINGKFIAKLQWHGRTYIHHRIIELIYLETEWIRPECGGHVNDGVQHYFIWEKYVIIIALTMASLLKRVSLKVLSKKSYIACMCIRI